MFDISHLTQTGGLAGLLIIGAIIFAESGLLIGFFLPGDTLLFGAGLAASDGKISLVGLVVTVVLAAIIGDNIGYSIGKRSGKSIFRKEDSILFQSKHIERAQVFYEKHGGKTIILARFVPVIRTFAPVVAGVGKMPRQRFMFFNIIGGVLWGTLMPVLGYTLGKRFSHLDKHIELVLIGVVVLSLMMAFGHILKEKESRQLLGTKLQEILRKIMLNKK